MSGMTSLSRIAASARRTWDDDAIIRVGCNVLEAEQQAVGTVRANLDGAFAEAVRIILNCGGRVAVTGMGKAGIVGRKIQATLASTATPAYALHPAEAIHGDLGMMQADDVVLALSNSGETQELVRLLPLFTKTGCKTILLTGQPQSTCARLSDVVVNIGDTPEACPLGLAPSSSTTAMLAAGDALALTVMTLKGVKPEQYAAYHPGGALGRSLMRVREIMRTGPDCPMIRQDDSLGQYYAAVQSAPRRAGAAAVVDDQSRLVGFFTHGDFVRCFGRDTNALDTRMSEVMTQDPKCVGPDDLVADALHIIQPHKIDELPVVDADRVVVGMIDVQDLVAHGFSLFDTR